MSILNRLTALCKREQRNRNGRSTFVRFLPSRSQRRRWDGGGGNGREKGSRGVGDSNYRRVLLEFISGVEPLTSSRRPASIPFSLPRRAPAIPRSSSRRGDGDPANGIPLNK